MIEPNQDMWCSECGQVKMMTSNGGVLCPSGHGRVISNAVITSRMLQNASRDRVRWKWLQALPVAKRVHEAPSGPGKPILLVVSGAKYQTCPPKGSRSSKAKWLAQPEPGMLLVNLEGEPRYARSCP